MIGSEKEIKSQLLDLTSLKELVETYEEIAISRMRKIRNSVLTTRDFITGLAQILGELSSSHREEIEKLKEKLKDPALPADRSEVARSILKHNGKTVNVLLAANTGLYGDIVQRTFLLFADYIQKHPEEDAVVIGRLGKRYMDESGITKDVTFFEMTDGFVDRAVTSQILEKLVVYEKILVFYGQFQSVVTQKPEMIDINGQNVPGATTGTPPLRQGLAGQASSQVVTKYLFEPSLETILEFFEKEILTSIFEQIVQESNLAKYASRMVSLDSATDNINSDITKTKFQGNIARHRTINRKQLNMLSGFSLWKIT